MGESKGGGESLLEARQGNNGVCVSFKDKVLGGSSLPPRDLLKDLIQKKLANVLCL